MPINRNKTDNLRRQQWQELEQELRHKPTQEDPAECDFIMARIQELPSRAVCPSKPPLIILRWAGAAVMAVVVLAVVLWNYRQESEQISNQMVEAQASPVTEPAQGNEPANSTNPLEMFAALQNEQVLVGKDLAKFQTMLNERVILFRQQP